ncbi:HlyD family efflux transporter periplasmic adaptor subunit [Colwellia demingiae]|uniref:HlyD family efflux transporter periplasmic adaptor subunit n=1 Tax=Colwellia demingiae TaxID=89401 RepID=A0A5C6QA39_9GAMM|nr:HlyD family efflux transporter periplasmic adaptor subunit [Colwellia demingiae]TWX65668.1 HlyD family efflux transporter periplasmic adaptor subunit [Colwellia demingiae]
MIQGTSGQDEVIANPKKIALKKILLTLSLLCVLSYVTFPTLFQWYSSIPSIDRKSINIETVILGDLIRDVVVSGKAVAANAPQLYSTEIGKITLLAKPGEAVALNQIVARLMSPELDALIKQQQSTLEQLSINANRGVLADKEAQLDLESNMNAAQSKLNVAKREFQRSEISYGKQIISEVDWLKSQDAVTDAKRLFEHAKKRVSFSIERLQFEKQHRDFLVQKEKLILEELSRRHDELAIKAPVKGVVGNWLVAKKNTIAANTAIMTIVDLSEYEAELSVPEFYADDLGIGLDVSMKISGVSVRGEIIAISPEVKGNQVTVRAKIKNSQNIQLRQNQRINARIEFEKKENVLMVKRGAFMGSLGGKFIFKLIEDNYADKTAITTGASSVEYIEITSGIDVGQQVITSDYADFNKAEQIYLGD